MPKDNNYMKRYRERRAANSGKPLGRLHENSNMIPLNTENGEFNRKIIYNLEHRLGSSANISNSYDEILIIMMYKFRQIILKGI